MVKTPGPDHPIEIGDAGGAFRVVCGGLILAQSSRALTLQEARYAPVLYFPREDVDLLQLHASATTSWCPYKGEASYFSLKMNGAAGIAAVADIAWSYETPLPAMQAIAGYLAFYARQGAVSLDRI